MKSLRTSALAAAAAALLTGCGQNDIHGSGQAGSGSTDQASGQSGDQTATRDDVVMPPRGYYDALFSAALQGLDQKNLGLADASPVLWVNFDGATITKGFALGQSFIPCQATSTVPAASDLSAADRDTVVKTVQQFYDDTGAHLVVTSTKPSSGDYTTVHVGGSYADLGCSGAGVAGIAPFDQGNANKNDVGFAFTKGADSAHEIAETVAHEAGHTFGLEHVDNNADLMFASESPSITGFAVSKVAGTTRVQDEPALLKQALGASAGPVAAGGNVAGSGAAATVPGLANLPAAFAAIPGLGQLAGIGQLLPGLSTTGGLDITKLLPQIQALLPLAAAGTNLQGLDKILAIVALANTGAATNAGANTAGGLAATILNAASGSQLPNLAGLTQLAGFANLGAALQGLQGLFGGSAPAGSATAAAAVPDLATLLGLASSGTNIAALLQSLTASAQVVNGNFSGADAQALLSLLKVAYSQQYLQVIESLII